MAKELEAEDIELKEYSFTPSEIEINGTKILDYTGIEHDRIYLCNKKDILDKARPSWIPEFDAKGLALDNFLPICVKDFSDGNYFVQSKVYTETRDANGKPVYKNQIYKMSPDVLAATVDYYLKRKRAELKREGSTEKVSLPRGMNSMPTSRYNEISRLCLLCEVPSLKYKNVDKSITDKAFELKGKNPGNLYHIQNNVVFLEQWQPLLENIKGKHLDMNYQKQDYIDSYSKALETAYGDSNTFNNLYKDFGVKIKKQNGSNFSKTEVDKLSEKIEKVFNYYGNLSNLASGYKLKISYANNCMQFARKAIGLFTPYQNAIGVSFFDEVKQISVAGENHLSDVTLAHEVAHWLDNQKGKETHNFFASDKYGTLENKIATKFKEEIKKRDADNKTAVKIGKADKKELGEYWFRTCECFARAMEQSYAISQGIDLSVELPYASDNFFKEEIQPLINELMEENRKHFGLENNPIRRTTLSKENGSDVEFYNESYEYYKNSITVSDYPRFELMLEDIKKEREYFSKNNEKEGAKKRLLELQAKEDFINSVSKEYKKIYEESQNNISDKDYIYSTDFKTKFGDWEKVLRLEKARKSESILVDISKIKEDENLSVYKKNAIAYGKTLFGDYLNEDRNEIIHFSGSKKNGGLYEVLEHDYKDIEHLQSISAIPEMIRKAVYITSLENEDKAKYPSIDSYDYYLCGLDFNGKKYTAKIVIASINGNKYYDHKLTGFEKGHVIDMIKEKSSQVSSVSITTQTPKTESLYIKDTRLLQICQCPQFYFLTEDLKPSHETVRKIKDGTLFLENNENGFQCLVDKTEGKVIGKKLQEYADLILKGNLVEIKHPFKSEKNAWIISTNNTDFIPDEFNNWHITELEYSNLLKKSSGLEYFPMYTPSFKSYFFETKYDAQSALDSLRILTLRDYDNKLLSKNKILNFDKENKTMEENTKTSFKLSTDSYISCTVKSTAEFDTLAEFEPITGLGAREAVAKYKELQNKGIDCSIAIFIRNDFIFDLSEEGISVLVRDDKKDTLNILGEDFVRNLKLPDQHSLDVILTFEKIYTEAKSQGLNIEKSPYIEEKKQELFGKLPKKTLVNGEIVVDSDSLKEITIFDIEKEQREYYIARNFNDIKNPSFSKLSTEEKAAVIFDMSKNVDFCGEFQDAYDLSNPVYTVPISFVINRIEKQDSEGKYPYFNLEYDKNYEEQRKHYESVINEYLFEKTKTKEPVSENLQNNEIRPAFLIYGNTSDEKITELKEHLSMNGYDIKWKDKTEDNNFTEFTCSIDDKSYVQTILEDRQIQYQDRMGLTAFGFDGKWIDDPLDIEILSQQDFYRLQENKEKTFKEGNIPYIKFSNSERSFDKYIEQGTVLSLKEADVILPKLNEKWNEGHYKTDFVIFFPKEDISYAPYRYEMGDKSPLGTISDNIHNFCSHPEVIDIFENNWKHVYTPSVKEEQEKAVKEIIKPVFELLEKSYKERFKELKEVLEADNKLHKSFIIDLEKSNDSKNSVKEVQNKISNIFTDGLKMAVRDTSDYIENNSKNLSDFELDEFKLYTEHQIINMIEDVKFGESRMALRNGTNHDFDFEAWRKSLEPLGFDSELPQKIKLERENYIDELNLLNQSELKSESASNKIEIKPVTLDEILSVMEFTPEFTEDGKIKVYDQQRNEYLDNRSNLPSFDEDNWTFSSAAEVFERMEIYISDYYINDMEEQLDEAGVTVTGNETLEDLCKLYKSELEKGNENLSLGELNLAMGIVEPDTVILQKGVVKQVEINNQINEPDVKTNYVLEKLIKAGIEVVTDKEEFEKILEQENILQKMNISEKSELFSTKNPENLEAEIDSVSIADINLQNKFINITSETPFIFKDFGMDNYPVNIYRQKLARALFLEKEKFGERLTHGHKGEFSEKEVKAVFKNIGNPRYIFNSKYNMNNPEHFYLVSVYDEFDKNGNPMMLSLHYNKNRKEVEANWVTSIYDKELNLLVNDWVKKGLLVYKNDMELERASEEVVALYMRVSNLQNPYEDIVRNKSDYVNNMNIIFYQIEDVTYGYTHNGKIYLNPDVMNSEAAVHEYTHLWDAYTQKTNPELWQKGLNIFKNTSIWNEVIEDENYADIKNDENLVLSECHARICGKIADIVLQNVIEEDGDLKKAEMIDWDKETWAYIASKIGFQEFDKVDPDLKLTTDDLKLFLSSPMKDLFQHEINLKLEQNKDSIKNDIELTPEQWRACDTLAEKAKMDWWFEEYGSDGDIHKDVSKEDLNDLSTAFDGYLTIDEKYRKPIMEIFKRANIEFNDITLLTTQEISSRAENLYGFYFEYNDDEKCSDIYRSEDGAFVGSYSDGGFGYADGMGIDVPKIPDEVFQDVIALSRQFYIESEKENERTVQEKNMDSFVRHTIIDEQKMNFLEFPKVFNTPKSLGLSEKEHFAYYQYELSLNQIKTIASAESDIVKMVEKNTDSPEQLDVHFVFDREHNKLSDFYIRYNKNNNTYTSSYVAGEVRESDISKNMQENLCKIFEGVFKMNQEIQTGAAEEVQSVNLSDLQVEELREGLKYALNEVAQPLPEIDFTRENYNKLFPRDRLNTPIETVKIGAHQFEKLEAKDRKNLLQAVHDVLSNPDVIINEEKESIFGDMENSHVYAKSYVINEKTKAVQSVVVNIEDEYISISTHKRDISNVVNKIKKPDQLLFAAAEVRLLAEQHTKEKLSQSVVNPNRENEYVIPPQTNIPQPQEKSSDENIHITDTNSSEEPELKTYHVLKEEDVKNLEIISDEDFSDIVDSIILNDYKNIPNTIRLPNIKSELAEKLGLEKDSAFIMKKSATHIRPDRKGSYNQAFDTEEYRMIPKVIRDATFALVDKRLNNFQIVFDDENDIKKINKLAFNKDELGNYLVTIGKIDRRDGISEIDNIVVGVGVAPTISALRYPKEPPATRLRPSPTTVNSNISQTPEKSSDEKSIDSFNIKGEKYSFSEAEQLLKEDISSVFQELDSSEIEQNLTLNGVKIYGNPEKDGKIKLLVEFDSKISENRWSEDSLFNAIAEENITFNGMEVDVNPITPEKSGTIEEYLSRLERLGAVSEAEAIEKQNVGIDNANTVQPFSIIDNKEKERVNIKFDTVHNNPEFKEIIKELKSNGWKFAPSTKQWYPVGDSVGNATDFAIKLQQKYSVSLNPNMQISSKESVYDDIRFFDRNCNESKELADYFNSHLSELGEKVEKISEKDATVILQAIGYENKGVLTNRNNRVGLDSNENLVIFSKDKSDVKTITTDLQGLIELSKERSIQNLDNAKKALDKYKTSNNISDSGLQDIFISLYDKCISQGETIKKQMEVIYDKYKEKNIFNNHTPSSIPELSVGEKLGNNNVCDVFKISDGIYQATLRHNNDNGSFDAGSFFVIDKNISELLPSKLKEKIVFFNDRSVIENKRYEPYIIRELIKQNIMPPRDSEYIQKLDEYIENHPLKYEKLYPITSFNFEQRLRELAVIDKDLHKNPVELGKKLISFVEDKDKASLKKWLNSNGCTSEENMKKVFTAWINKNEIKLNKNNGYPPRGD